MPTAAPAGTCKRTGRLTTLLPPRAACDRGSQTVHAAEETVLVYQVAGYEPETLLYPEFTALCGQRGWGAAERPLADVNCPRCLRTNRFSGRP